MKFFFSEYILKPREHRLVAIVKKIYSAENYATHPMSDKKKS